MQLKQQAPGEDDEEDDEGHLECEQVALQTVSDEDGLRPEHAEQNRLNVSQGDGGVHQVLLSDA